MINPEYYSRILLWTSSVEKIQETAQKAKSPKMLSPKMTNKGEHHGQESYNCSAYF